MLRGSGGGGSSSSSRSRGDDAALLAGIVVGGGGGGEEDEENVDRMSDAAVAAALGLGASYDPATDVAVLAPPVPTGKIGVHGHSSGDGRNNGKRWKGLPAPREDEMDERLYAHAANMSTSAIRWGADPFHTLLKHHGQHQQHQRNRI